MPREMGPRERQLREQREAEYEENQQRAKLLGQARAAERTSAENRDKLVKRVAAVKAKTEKPKKGKHR